MCEIEIERKDTSSLFDIISIDSFCNLTTGRAKICLNTLCVCVCVCSYVLELQHLSNTMKKNKLTRLFFPVQTQEMLMM